jgi:hypothetical protein
MQLESNVRDASLLKTIVVKAAWQRTLPVRIGTLSVTRLSHAFARSAKRRKYGVTRGFASQPRDRFAFIEDARRQASRIKQPG